MKIGTLRKSSALLAYALLSIGTAATAADPNYNAHLGLSMARTPASINLNANAESSTALALAAVKKASNYAACAAGCMCATCTDAAKQHAGLSGVGKVGYQEMFLVKGEDAGAMFLMDAKHDVGVITKVKTVDLAPLAKKLVVDAKMNGGGAGCAKYDVAHDGSSDKVRGTGQQYGADMAHRAGVVIASVERPDATA